MTCFRTFTPPLCEIFSGNLLLLICTLFYLAWWAVSFRPNSSGSSAGVFYIAIAFATGLAGIALMSGGINTLSPESKFLQVKYILAGCTGLFIVLLLVTSVIFRRSVTSELLIIHIWLALELSAIAVLYGTGRFGAGQAAALAALVAIATVIGLICYVLYYRLDEAAGYRIGMVPLAADALVMTVFLGVMTVS